MKATRLDIVFDTCVDQEEEYEIINKKIHALFGDDAITDWRDEKTVEITIFRHDVGISTPRSTNDTRRTPTHRRCCIEPSLRQVP
jgi:hypothetical protein